MADEYTGEVKLVSQNPTFNYDDYVMPEKEKGALEAGFDKAAASFAQSASQINVAFGQEYGAQFWKDIADDKYEEYRKFNPTVPSYRDIDNFGDLMDYVGENILTASPELAAMFFGRIGLVANAINYFGDTVNQQIENGEEVNVNRALITSGAESLLNIPISKAAKGIFTSVDNSNLTDEAKKNIISDLVKGFATDAGVNGAQQVLRNYGVEGEVSLKDVDEAVVGGVLTTSPIRLAESVVNKAKQAQLAEVASDEAVASGDVTKADNLMQSALNFAVGTAMAPVNRFLEGTESGKALATKIENMRTERELMASQWNIDVQSLAKNEKGWENLRRDYSAGKRDTPELQKLDQMMRDVHSRANIEFGANLGTGYIQNYLPTNFDPKLFGKEQQVLLKKDYHNWYNAQVIKEGLTTPEVADKMIDGFAVSLDESNTPNIKLPKITMDDDGNLIGSPIVDARSPLTNGQLEKSRLLGFIPQHILNEYAIQRNFKEQLLSYGQSAAHRISYAEQLGKNNEYLNADITNMAKEAEGVGSQRITRQELDTIYNALDAYQGTYNQFQNETAKKFSSVVRSLTNVITLPLTTLSSLTEPFNVAIKVGNAEAGKAFVRSLGSISRDLISTFTNGIIDKSETNKQLLLAGRSFKDATTALNNRINGEFLTPWMQNFNNAFFHATGQTAINYLVNTMAVHAMKSQVKNDIQTLSGNPRTKAYTLARERMEALGITPAVAREMHLKPDVIRQYEPAMVARFNRDVALNPQALDKPLWHSTGWGALVAQIRGYPTMFSNTVLPKLYRLVDPRGKTSAEVATDLARFSMTTGAILTVGFLQESIKNEVRGTTLTDEELYDKAFTNTLLPMQMSYLRSVASGEVSRLVLPASVSVYDRQYDTLVKAINGEAGLSDIPVLSSAKGVINE